MPCSLWGWPTIILIIILIIIFCNLIIIKGVNKQPYLKTKHKFAPEGINLSSVMIE
jgi:hypothetical protein